MEKLPFTSFDFWGYLAAGFLLLAAIDNAGHFGLLTLKDWNIVAGILAVASAYVLGHVIASVSAFLFERGLVGKVLGWPSQSLFGKCRPPRWAKRVLKSYYSELPAQTQQAIESKAAASGITGAGEALFWLAFAKARSSDRTMARLADFLNQYSFCRNVAAVAFADAGILWWAHWQPQGTQLQLVVARAAAVVGVVLLLRYLKFLRHYSLELFIAFAYAEDAKPKVP